jgi:hypothetical protein
VRCHFILVLTQMCAKYDLLDVAQYKPVACVISVATNMIKLVAGN